MQEQQPIEEEPRAVSTARQPPQPHQAGAHSQHWSEHRADPQSQSLLEESFDEEAAKRKVG